MKDKKCIGCGKPGVWLCGRMWFILIYITMFLLGTGMYLGWIPLP